MEPTNPLAITLVLLMLVFLCQADVDTESRGGQNMTVEECTRDKPLLCSDKKCYALEHVCKGQLQHCDEMFFEYCSHGRVSIGWPWYHWVLACAFGGAACILAIYGLYLVWARRQQRQQQDQIRGDRDSQDGGTPVRFISRDSGAQTKYNTITQTNEK